MTTAQALRFVRTHGVVRESDSILVCRLVNRKVTLVHKRLWPAVVRVADRFPPRHLARIVEIHTAAGHHRVEETPFPDWVPRMALATAESLSEREALRALGTWIP